MYQNRNLPSAEDNDISGKLASISKLQACFGETFQSCVILQLNLSINDVLTTSDIFERMKYEKYVGLIGLPK